MKLKNVINKHKSNKIKENSNTVRHLNNGTDHRHSKSCCDQSSPARRTIKTLLRGVMTKHHEKCDTSLNSLRPSDAYMRRWSNHHWFRQWLVALPAPSHYLNQCWNIVNWTLGIKLQWKSNRNSDIFIQENAFESVVCEMAAMLSRPRCVKIAIEFLPNISANHRITSGTF